MIPVTKTFLPPIEDYNVQLQRIWENQWLTNNGELYKELSGKLKAYLGVNNIIPMTNGTLPIQIALNAFADQGEVITTPFSYVATTSSIIWEKCVPVFVDIHPNYLTIDEEKIEAAITSRTKVILATHVYGNPCNIDVIDQLAKKYQLKVIYDAAHCFGVKYKGESVFNFGDVSTCSFHATKLFHTGEGGALFCQNDEILHQMRYRHNFGHNGNENYFGVGINAKMNELQAAMGLAMLPYIDNIIKSRKEICESYNLGFDNTQLSGIKLRENCLWNYSYYPIIFKSEEILLQCIEKLNNNDIYPRRYFFPSLNLLPYCSSQECPISVDISKRILCLPLYYELYKTSQEKVINIVNSSIL